MKKYKYLFVLILFLILSLQDYAQQIPCPQCPAPCPDEGDIQASISRSIRVRNGVLPKEVNMQDKMRTLITDMMQQAAKNLHWQMVEIDEYTNNGPMQSGSTAAPLRSPRGLEIFFQFVVNRDSLMAWRSWLNKYSTKGATAMQNDMQHQQNIANSPLFKRYQDSADYYENLIDKDQGDERLAIADMKKAKQFSDKKFTLLKRNNSESNLEQMNKEKALKTDQFRNVSILQIDFNFNTGKGIIHGEAGNAVSSNIKIPGAYIAKMVHVQHADPNETLGKFDRWENMIVILSGRWLSKLDEYQNYQAAFSLNGQDDEHTPKKIKSYMVQTISVHIMGNKVNIRKMATQLNMQELNSAIGK